MGAVTSKPLVQDPDMRYRVRVTLFLRQNFDCRPAKEIEQRNK